MFTAERIHGLLSEWMHQLYSSQSNRVSIIFSVAQTKVGFQRCGPAELQQIKDWLHLKFNNNVRYVGVVNFHLSVQPSKLADVLGEIQGLQDKLKLYFHVGVGVICDNPDYAQISASDAWLASVRLGAGGPVNYGSFFSRDEILNFIQGTNGDKFELYFQPKICGATDQVVGYEALARLICNGEFFEPNRKNRRSCNFLEAISANGLQNDFDYWLIKKVAPLVNKNENISINLLASALTNDIFELIIAEIQSDALKFFEIEILEHEELTKSSLDIVYELRKHGVSFSVDDFGKGVSNIGMLQKIPHGSTIKVDFSFVLDSHLENEESRRKQQIQIAIAQLAKTYNHKIVFEGVEVEEILINLKKIIVGIDIALENVKFQGYFREGVPKPWEHWHP